MVRKVEVVTYSSDWPKQFEKEANLLRYIFGDQVVAIYHFGSTSIPGLSAKPIIDILLTVIDINAVDALNARMVASGYRSMGEYGIPGRRFFYKGTSDNRSHHLHIYQFDNPHILRHLAFRDYMRSHPLPARQYARLKEQLAKQFPEDIDGYIAGKNDFVRQQEANALAWWRKKGKRSVSD